jgi:hypothetical protein
MLKKDDKVDDRSRNGSNAGNPSDGENVTLIKAVEKTAGERIKYGRRKFREFHPNSQFPKRKILNINPEWVLEKLPHTHYLDVDGNVSVNTGNATDANFIELALTTLQISFEAYDYFDDSKGFVFGFDFKLEDIQHDSLFWKSLKIKSL